jgi:uncharacterized membrane protein YkvA (DUF1232 family)
VLAIVAYALSPIDLVPDFIPVLGYLDELILLPIAVTVALRLIPDHVLADARARPGDMAPRQVDRDHRRDHRDRDLGAGGVVHDRRPHGPAGLTPPGRL